MSKDRQSHIEAREKRMKEALRVNLQRRKQKARALKTDENKLVDAQKGETQSENSD